MKPAARAAAQVFLRRLVRWAWVAVLTNSGLIRYAKHKLAQQGSVVVLTFHRVLEEGEFQESLSLAGMKVRLKTFQGVVRFLLDEGCVDDPFDCRPLPGSKLRFMITFDDGWLDNYHALLQTPGASPSIVFLCPGLMNQETPFWHEQVASVIGDGKTVETEIESLKSLDRERREKKLSSIRQQRRTRNASRMDRTMTWDQTAALRQCGIRFGSHTDSHQMLPSVSKSRMAEEVAGSIGKIEQTLKQPCEMFAYPNGDWCTASRQMLQDCGIRRAFTTTPGVWTEHTDPLTIPRINMCEEKFVGPLGKFSRSAAAYQLIWKCWRISRSNPLQITRSPRATVTHREYTANHQ